MNDRGKTLWSTLLHVYSFRLLNLVYSFRVLNLVYSFCLLNLVYSFACSTSFTVFAYSTSFTVFAYSTPFTIFTYSTSFTVRVLNLKVFITHPRFPLLRTTRKWCWWWRGNGPLLQMLERWRQRRPGQRRFTAAAAVKTTDHVTSQMDRRSLAHRLIQESGWVTPGR